jgi:lipopolysaccharide export system ATP-binding protein
VADRAYILHSGRILCAGTPSELSTDAEVRRIYLGNNFRLN